MKLQIASATRSASAGLGMTHLIASSTSSLPSTLKLVDATISQDITAFIIVVL